MPTHPNLIAVTTCHAFRDRADAVRSTWGAELDGVDADIKYFLGRDQVAQRPDEIILDCPDGYHYLSQKTQLIRRWALEHGYHYLWKVDDDVYLRPERLFASFQNLDYVGRLRGCSGSLPGPYCSGFTYGLSRKSLELLAPFEWGPSEDFSEDRWTGNKLLSLGISPHHEKEFVVHCSKANAISGREAPLVGNAVISSCEYSPKAMQQVHAEFKSGKRSTAGEYHQPAGSLSRVSVMVKTFLRDGYLMSCLDGLEKNFADTKIVVVDDGWDTGMTATFNKITRAAEMRRKGHSWINMPFDSGFGAKANLAIMQCDREYVLIASDDFDFSDPAARAGVEAMQKVLDAVPSLALVSGRVDHNPYEFCWEAGDHSLRELRCYHGSGEVDGTKYHLCDLTVNYSLIRTKIFQPQHGALRWDGGEVKIGGGEHSAFFIDLQRAYWSVAYVEGVNINQLPRNFQWMHKSYPAMRARARTPGRPCLKKRGIDVYVLADGSAEVS